MMIVLHYGTASSGSSLRLKLHCFLAVDSLTSLTMPKFVTQLNNYFQARGDTTAVSYSEAVDGPSDKAQWTVICKVSGQTKGTGKAASKAAAKEEAARQTLQALGVAV
ncbi:hypothetical protein BDZ89DRAFT_227693 [Hymenopellis radicata]|nr:hypothetical protein BDZ89DRAFT_227693 [Hymenopellis radicata]